MKSHQHFQSGCRSLLQDSSLKNSTATAPSLFGQIHRQIPSMLAGFAAVAFSALPAQAELDIEFTFGSSVNQDQKTAFELAGLVWEEFLVDDVEINLYVD
ncbi:MAG: hypothetical protein ACFBSC_10555, partial [Microcoleaceae cyanobacterium]